MQKALSTRELIRVLSQDQSIIYKMLDLLWHWDRHVIREVLDTLALRKHIDNEQWSDLCTYYKC